MSLDNSGTFLIANAILDALHPGTGTATVGTKTITAPIRIKCCTAAVTPTATAVGTEITPGNAYVSIATVTTGGISIGNNWAAAASGSKSTNAIVSLANMPAATITWVELYDNSATPQRIDWPASFTAKTTASGDTLSFASGQITCTLA
jgi:hypothetical protein